ncbi:EpsG family protein [Enterococcus casseliflavus]|uniref:EpsG family protein n=1 Tax=Enterococcus casseliflavus TaxID=37734 RepID=UPI0035D8F53E
MTIYIFSILTCILMMCFANKKSYREKKYVCIVSSILIIISGLRNVGTDVINYKNYFEILDFYNFGNSLYERGYYLINKIVQISFNDFQYVLIFTSLFIILLITKTIVDFSVYPLLSLFFFITLYFYFTSFNLVRQYIAMAIVFASIKYIIEKKLCRFIFIIIFASFFHSTSLFFIPFYWIARKKMPDVYYWLVFIATLVLTIFIPLIINIVSFIFPRLSYYSDYSLEGASANFAFVVTSITFICAKILFKKLIIIDGNANLYMNFVFYASCFSILSRNNIIFFRISSYFYIFIILLIPIIYKSLTKNLKFLFLFYMIPASTIYMCYLIMNNNAGVYPYDFSVFYTDDLNKYLFLILGLLIVCFHLFFKRKKD